jgi:hypothetical protein
MDGVLVSHLGGCCTGFNRVSGALRALHTREVPALDSHWKMVGWLVKWCRSLNRLGSFPKVEVGCEFSRQAVEPWSL